MIPQSGSSFEIPFGITKDELTQYATSQFFSRLSVIEAAKGRSLSETEGVEEEELEGRLEDQDHGRQAEVAGV